MKLIPFISKASELFCINYFITLEGWGTILSLILIGRIIRKLWNYGALPFTPGKDWMHNLFGIAWCITLLRYII